VIDPALLSSIAEQMWTGSTVTVPGKNIPLKRTSYQRLKTLTFEMNRRKYQALEQNAVKLADGGSWPGKDIESCSSGMCRPGGMSLSRWMEK